MSEPIQNQTSSGNKMIITMVLVATICGVLIVGAFESTKAPIAENKRIMVERAVFKVLPGAASVREYAATASGIQPLSDGAVPEGGVKFYAAYDQSGALKGIAAEAASKGYADTVRLLYGYEVKCQCIIGIGVVSMRETPGIGDRILTDQAFLKNFEALDVRVNPEMTALANAVKTVSTAPSPTRGRSMRLRAPRSRPRRSGAASTRARKNCCQNLYHISES